MDMKAITRKKQDGEVLNAEEIAGVVIGYTRDLLTDDIMTAWLKAVYASGMSFVETLAMTRAMVASGETVDLSSIAGFKVDKHSTGGVGDKTTLVVAPLAAACGLKVAKMSGRALGHTGGTLDKLEVIPGFSVDLDRQTFIDQVKKIGVAITGQTQALVPADKKIYALRDKTKTVASLPLIASSIMSKKIAAGADYIVLDVKAGRGAFMKTPEEARKLAELCVKIGEAAGRRVSALITNMNRPLGQAVGNTLEVREAILSLHGRGPDDVKELASEIVVMMLLEAGLAETGEKAAEMIKEAVRSGAAVNKMGELIAAQGGNRSFANEPSNLPLPVTSAACIADQDGYVISMDTEHIGWLAKRTRGLLFMKKTGDEVRKNETIASVYADSREAAEVMAQALRLLVETGPAKPPDDPLIYARVSGSG